MSSKMTLFLSCQLGSTNHRESGTQLGSPMLAPQSPTQGAAPIGRKIAVGRRPRTRGLRQSMRTVTDRILAYSIFR